MNPPKGVSQTRPVPHNALPWRPHTHRALEDAHAALDLALERAADADAAVKASRHPLGGSPEQRRARREAEGAAARAEEAAAAAGEAAAEAEEAVEDLRLELSTVRRAVGPVRWQSDRMARMEAAAAVGAGWWGGSWWGWWVWWSWWVWWDWWVWWGWRVWRGGSGSGRRELVVVRSGVAGER